VVEPAAQQSVEGGAGSAVFPGVDPEPPPTPPPDLLPDYLATRDAPCPHCGYNLRGVEGGACPECGGRIQLSLLKATRFAGHGLFILLALTWVFLAAGMNAARQGQLIYQDAMRVNLVSAFFTSTTSITVNGNTTVTTTGPQGTQRFSVQGNGAPGGATGGAGGPRGAIGVGPGRSGAQTLFGRTGPNGAMTWTTVPPTGGAAPKYNWSAVPSERWWTFGWWGGLVLLALLGLMVFALVRLRWGGASRGLSRAAVWYASVLFACYAVYHVQAFTREAMHW
jgi:hypothetical protein